MALFRRNDGFEDALQRLRTPAGLEGGEIEQLLNRVLADGAASTESVGWMLGSEQPRIRQAGFEFLATHSARDCADLLLEAFAAAPMQRRRDLCQLLARLDRRLVAESLRRAYASQAKDCRGAVLDIVGYGFPIREVLPLLKHAIADGSPHMLRQQAARLLRRAAQDPTIALLLRALVHDEDEVVRTEAIGALCEHPSPDAVDTLFARLPHEQKDLQAKILAALGQLAQSRQTPQLEERLFAVLADDCAEIRPLAAQLLVRMPDAAGVLRRFLEHSRGLAVWLRERAHEALATVVGQLSHVLAQLIEDRDRDVRMAAMLLAARCNDPGIVPHVVKVFLRDPDWWTCSVAADILGRFPSPQIQAVLLQRLGDPDLRYSVVSALGALPGEDVTRVLLQLLRDPDRSIRVAALRGLHGRASEAVASAMQALANHDPEEQVREHALLGLESLGEHGKSLAAGLLGPGVVEAAAAEEPLTLEMENPALRGG